MTAISLHPTVTPTTAVQSLIWNLMAGLVTMIKGSPSTAKSAVVGMVARKFNLKLIDVRVASLEPPDLTGMPFIDQETKRASYFPFDTFPLVGQELPINPETGEQYAGWLLFLDEINAGEDDVTKAAYKLINDRAVGQYDLHANCFMIAAGNLEDDGALVEDMGSAMQSRMTYLRMVQDVVGWRIHANQQGFDPRVIAYMDWAPDDLYTFDPKRAAEEDNYGCYRTWEFVSKQLSVMGDQLDNPSAFPIIAGSLGHGLATKFRGFLDIIGELPKWEVIKADPANAPIPEKESAQYGMTGMIIQHMLEDAEAVITYLERFRKEMQVVAFRNVTTRYPEMWDNPLIEQWAAKNAFALM